MKKENAKQKNTEAQLLELLQTVLPKAIDDPKLAGKVFQAVQQELKLKNRADSFDKFCSRLELPDLEPKTLNEVHQQFTETFGDADITIKPNKKEQSIAVEVNLPDGTQLSSAVKARPVNAEAEEEQEIKLQFVPFPVSLPGDPELAWILARRENMTAEEAGIALSKIEDDFWGSKSGQKLLRDRVERIFPEFIARVPAGMLNELGLKRHYKTPEPIKVLQPAPAAAKK